MTDDKNNSEKLPKCGYPLNTIYFYLTQGCNLCCRHCWIDPEFQGKGELKSAFISLDIFKNIIQQGKELGLSSVKLTGGEPLLHPDISELLSYLATQDLSLVIESNGVLCTKELTALIKKNKKPFVSVSLDSSEPETHEWVRGVKGSFEGAVNGLKNLVEAEVNNQIIMSVMRKNADHIEDMVHFAEELGVTSLKLNLIVPTARGKDMHKKGETLSIEELIDLGKWIENDLSKKSDIDIMFSHPVAFRPLSRIFDDPGGRCGIKGIIGVLGAGKYALCGIGETVEELIFGDARTDRLEDVWNSNRILNDIRTGFPEKLQGVCEDCIHKSICLGTCVASNFYQTRNLFAPYWFCDQAYRNGLFPASRIKRI